MTSRLIKPLRNSNEKLMWLSLIVALLTTSLNIEAQKHDNRFAENTRLTCKLLDTLQQQIDSSIQLIIIEGDVYSDTTFEIFASKYHIPSLIVQTIKPDGIYPEKPVKSIAIQVRSNPFMATVSFGTMLFDEMGNISGYLSVDDPPVQKWGYDRLKKKFTMMNLPDRAINTNKQWP